jgi:uncharacterized protein (DUF488 family)
MNEAARAGPNARGRIRVMNRVFTIGHSTRTLDEFLSLLRSHEIERVVDVRSLPRSRRMPHFSGPTLAIALEQSGVAYSHLPGLGGLRSPSTAARHAGLPEAFRGYAAHMETTTFRDALMELLRLGSAGARRVPVAEADPSQHAR